MAERLKKKRLHGGRTFWRNAYVRRYITAVGNKMTVQGMTVQSMTIQNMTIRNMTVQEMTIRGITVQEMTKQKMTVQEIFLIVK